MPKFNKKLLLTSLGVSALAVSVPLALTSCQQAVENDSNFGNGNGQPGEDNGSNNGGNTESTTKKDAIASSTGKDYTNSIVLNNSSVDTLKSFVESNTELMNSIKSVSLSDETQFKNVSFTLKDVKAVENENFELVFSAKPLEGHLFTNGSSTEINVSVKLTNVTFKDALASSTFNYTNAIQINTSDKNPGVDTLTKFLTNNNNSELNKIVNNVKSSISSSSDFAYIKNIEFKNNSIVKNGNTYQLTLVATSSDKHFFADGTTSKEIIVSLSSVKFVQTLAVANDYTVNVNSIVNWAEGTFGQDIYGGSKNLDLSKSFLIQGNVMNNLKKILQNNGALSNANVVMKNFQNVKVLEGNKIQATYTATTTGGYLFENGSTTKNITVTITNIPWAEKYESVAKNATYSLSTFADANLFATQRPNLNSAKSFFINETNTKKIINKLAADGNLKNASIVLDQSSIQLVGNTGIKATYDVKSSLGYAFAPGITSTKLTVTINVKWMLNGTASVQDNVVLDMSDVTWFAKQYPENSTMVKWFNTQNGAQVILNKLNAKGAVVNATIQSIDKWADILMNWQNLPVKLTMKTLNNTLFSNGSDTQQITVYLKGLKWYWPDFNKQQENNNQQETNNK